MSAHSQFVRAIQRGQHKQPASANIVKMFYGTVTQVSPLMVELDGTTTSQSAVRLADYAPTRDDFVACLYFRRELIVLGVVTT